MAFIYKILNKVDGKIYVGSTKRENPKFRWYNHTTELRKNRHHNSVLQLAWNKYGEDNFEFLVLEEVSDDKQFIVEDLYLDKLQPFPPVGYNLVRKAQNHLNTKYRKGEYHPKSVLTSEKVEAIKVLMAEGYSNKEIKDKLNVSMDVLSGIKGLSNWAHVRHDLNKKIKENTNNVDEQRRINNKNHTLFIEKIMELHRNKFSIGGISKELNISENIVRKDIYREKNKHRLLNCLNCGEEFYKNSNNHKYCSTKCNKIHKQ